MIRVGWVYRYVVVLITGTSDCGSAHCNGCVVNGIFLLGQHMLIINPRCACAARVGSWVCVRVSVPTSHLWNGYSSHKRYNLLNGQFNEGQMFSLKTLRRRVRALPV